MEMGINWVTCAAPAPARSSSIERVVEDLVQEAMQRGEFKNLRGAGRPLAYDADGHSLFVDRSELALNRILARQGFVPEWVQLRRTIKSLTSHTLSYCSWFQAVFSNKRYISLLVKYLYIMYILLISIFHFHLPFT